MTTSTHQLHARRDVLLTSGGRSVQLRCSDCELKVWIRVNPPSHVDRLIQVLQIGHREIEAAVAKALETT